MRIFGASAFAAVVIVLGAKSVRADEGIYPLAASGDWYAAEHRPNMTGRPDVCIAMNMVQGVAFRAGYGGVEFRVINSKWSLPSHVQGEVSITVGSVKQTLEIDANDSTFVSASVSPEFLVPLFTAMDDAANMSVTVGKAKPVIVSLTGSTRVTNAFRTCAGINSNAKTPGSNPFE